MHRGSVPLAVSSRMRTACFGNLLASCWRERVDVEDVRRLFPVTEQLLARYPAGVATMNVIEDATLAPDDARLAGSKQIQELGPRLLCTTNILLGGGLWVAAGRAITSMVNLLSKRPLPMLVTPSIADGARWTAPRLGTPEGHAVESSDLARFIEELLLAFREQAA